jgi:penicillin-binding protein 1A
MLRAIWVNLRSNSSRQGASTITQQVVKNVLLTQDRTYERKFKEVILSRRIEQELSKDEILELYLNHIYFGHGRYGVEEASRYYFGKGVHDITLGEATLLAGAGVRRAMNLAHRRQPPGDAYVLDQMVDKGSSPPAWPTRPRRRSSSSPPSRSTSELAPEVAPTCEAARGRWRQGAEGWLHRDDHDRSQASSGGAQARRARCLRQASEGDRAAQETQEDAAAVRG